MSSASTFDALVVSRYKTYNDSGNADVLTYFASLGNLIPFNEQLSVTWLCAKHIYHAHHLCANITAWFSISADKKGGKGFVFLLQEGITDLKLYFFLGETMRRERAR